MKKSASGTRVKIKPLSLKAYRPLCRPAEEPIEKNRIMHCELEQRLRIVPQTCLPSPPLEGSLREFPLSMVAVGSSRAPIVVPSLAALGGPSS